jgi:hypothetical protein
MFNAAAKIADSVLCHNPVGVWSTQPKSDGEQMRACVWQGAKSVEISKFLFIVFFLYLGFSFV